jgi:hypothetical protein
MTKTIKRYDPHNAPQMRKDAMTEYLLAFDEHYHGYHRKECLLVKSRIDMTSDVHYLEYWICLTHNKETCRCGWEFGHHSTDLTRKKTCVHKKNKTE